MKEKILDDENMVEIVRSFSYKLNLGNYENKDFFCSLKATAPISQFEEVSNMLFTMCKKQVIDDVEREKGMSKVERKEKVDETGYDV